MVRFDLMVLVSFTVILSSVVQGGYMGVYPNSLALPLALQRNYPPHHSAAAKGDYNSYYTSVMQDNEIDIMSRIEQVYMDRLQKLHSNSRLPPDGEDTKIATIPAQQGSTYLLVKSMRQRNKRYVSYLTLCHFKICNMGRKRTVQYVTDTGDDNEVERK